MNRDKEKNRKLTEAEKARSVHFENAKRTLTQEGYEAKDMTMGVVYANVMSLVLALPFVLVLSALYIVLHPDFLTEIAAIMERNSLAGVVAFFASLVVLAVVHEVIHGITWAAFAKKHWKSVAFGFIAEYLTPYCTCSEALGKWPYIVGALMPTLLLGIAPALFGAVAGNAFALLIGLMMILAGGGDLMIARKLLAFKAPGKTILCMDHPYEVGLVAFVK